MPDAHSPQPSTAQQLTAEDEVVQLCSELIRFESVNTGDPDTIGNGEAQAARYIQQKLEEVGYETFYVESVPGRGNVVCRLEGADRTRGSLLIHGHVDVVPAQAQEWTVDPFSGAVQDGFVWGRGAVDMKDMLAMMVAVAREFKRSGDVPPRDLIFAFVSDEEAGGTFGAQWLVDFYPELFADATEAISEVGGFSITLDDARRAYLVAAAEKGVAWAHLTATGRAGHGSMMNDDNAVLRIANAVARLGNHEFPLTMTATVRSFLDKIHELTGLEFPDDDLAGSVAKIGPVSRIIGATLRNTATPTMLKAGYKANVIPSSAEATVDCRVLPGSEEHFREQIAEIVGEGIEITWTWQPPLEVPFAGPLVEAMKAALTSEDVGSVAVPY
ncbi:MAG: M20/M25/M40 family metallo-hydrolase, partial [Actinomycetota bacterium]|nr:M20/M25/M40 family metallo-hydrolase [Actinomycetota bacterium]